MAEENGCERHRLAGSRTVCAHLAALVVAREPVHVAARIEVDLGELALSGAPVVHLYCRECAELHRLPALSHLPSEDEANAPSFEALVAVCATCLDEALEAAEARRAP